MNASRAKTKNAYTYQRLVLLSFKNIPLKLAMAQARHETAPILTTLWLVWLTDC